MEAQIKTTAEIRTERRREAQATSDLVIACLWPKKDSNLGTILRTCDAVNARLVAPRTPVSRKAVTRGNTIGLRNSPLDLIDDEWFWLSRAAAIHRTIAVELAHGATPLADLEPASGRTLVIMGHESSGVPAAALSLCDEVVEIPMAGVGNSLNVAVAASLVLYKLRGWI